MHNENSFIPNSQETVIAFRHNYLTIALDPHQTCARNVRHRFKLLSCLPQYRFIAILLDSLNTSLPKVKIVSVRKIFRWLFIKKSQYEQSLFQNSRRFLTISILYCNWIFICTSNQNNKYRSLFQSKRRELTILQLEFSD